MPQPAYNSPLRIAVPRTTSYYQRKRAAEDTGATPGDGKRKYVHKGTFNVCKHCHMPKTVDFGHSRHIGEHGLDTFCPSVEGRQYAGKEAWLEARKKENPPKKSKK